MRNYVLSTGERHIESCNFNSHSRICHYDRNLPVHDLIYMMEGEFEIYEEDHVFNIQEGDLLLLYAGHRHFGKKPCSERVKTMFFHIIPKQEDRISENINSEEAFVFPQKLSIPKSSQIPELLKQCVESYWDGTVFSNIRADAYISLALCEITALAKNDIFLCNDHMIAKILSLLHSTPERFFSVNEMCKMINISPKTLYNSFLKNTGQSPHQYQINMKLEQARVLIEESPELKLKEIAMCYGFSDEYHFSKLYKRRFGHSPKFRR